MKKIITMVAALTLIAGLLTGCGSKGSSVSKGAEGRKADSTQTVPLQSSLYSTLQKLGLGHFDSWASAFGERQTAIDVA